MLLLTADALKKRKIRILEDYTLYSTEKQNFFLP